MEAAINTLKNNKTIIEDKINSELLKAGRQELRLRLFRLIQTVIFVLL